MGCLLGSAMTLAGEDHTMYTEPDRADAGEHAHEHRSHSKEKSEHAHGQAESERAHVPPDPPKNPMPDVSEERMIELMQMEDDGAYGMMLLDQLEWREGEDGGVQVWEAQAWYGTDYNKVWFETEGVRADGHEDGRVEIMWDRIISPWWSVQTGVRQDFGRGPSRTWADFGIQGLAPHFLDVDAALYVGEEGRTAARFSGEYDAFITQRLILQPELELELYGKDDPENGIGSGLSTLEIALRLRYEIRREFAPYVGVHWNRQFGETADLAHAVGDDPSEITLVAGLRAWF